MTTMLKRHHRALRRHPYCRDPDHPGCRTCYEPPVIESGDLEFLYQGRIIRIEWDYYPESGDIELTGVSDQSAGQHNGTYHTSAEEARQFTDLALKVAQIQTGGDHEAG